MLWKFLLISFKSYLSQFRTGILYLDKRFTNLRLCEKLRVRSTVCQSYSHKNYLVFTFMSRLTLYYHDLITRHQTHALDSLIHFFEFLLGQFLHQIKGIRWLASPTTYHLLQSLDCIVFRDGDHHVKR